MDDITLQEKTAFRDSRRTVPRARLVAVAACLVGMLVTACNPFGPSAPTATPVSPFNQLAAQAAQAFDQGLQQFQQGDYPDALQSFLKAQLLSPTDNPDIDTMVARTEAVLTPTVTVGPTGAATATAAPLALNQSQPDTSFGADYFGQVYLTAVPGQNTVPAPQSTFYYQDQVGLYVQALSTKLRLPLEMRVFNLDTLQPVADAVSDGTPPVQAVGAPGSNPNATTLPAATGTPLPGFTPTVAPASQASGGAASSATPVVRFWDNFVWYHQGGEPVGRFRVELYAGQQFTNTFDYTVGVEPVPAGLTPTPEATTTPETTAIPVGTPPPPGAPEGTAVTPPAATPAAAPAGAPGAPGAASPAPLGTPVPTPTATIQPTPTPAPAPSTLIGGVPAGLDVTALTGQVFVADASGEVWTINGDRPSLSRPFRVNGLPVDITVDQTTGHQFITVRQPSALIEMEGSSGQIIRSISLPVEPTFVQYDPSLGLAYVVLPQREGLAVVDVAANAIRTITPGIAQVTGLALDATSHTLYVAHLSGQVSVIDGQTGIVTQRTSVSAPGVTGIATARGMAYVTNSSTNELVMLDPSTREVTHYPLPTTPAAVTVGEQSGTVYVLLAKANMVARIDPTDGSIVGQALLPARSGQFGLQGQGDFRGLSPRMTINPLDESVYVTQPETGTLSIIPPDLFPPLQNPVALGTNGIGPLPSDPGRSSLLAQVPASPDGRTGTTQSAAAVAPRAPDWGMGGGRFFTEANGLVSGAATYGFAVLDGGGARFWSAFQQLGGVGSLGYPTSRRFVWRGYLVQATQRGLLQWSPYTQQASLVNLLDELHNAGDDARLQASYAIPQQSLTRDEQGMRFDQVVAERQGWLDADPLLKAAYFSVPDPLQRFGLPTSQVQDMGPLVAIRTQRAVLQRWKDNTPWAAKDTVTLAPIGDVARDLGLFGSSKDPFSAADPTYTEQPTG